MQITSDPGKEFIARWEGVVLHVYNDAVGKPTIGVGHLIKPGESFTTITLQQAYDLLGQDLKMFEAAIDRLVTAPLSQTQFDALMSFTYNLGVGSLAKSTLLQRLNTGDYAVGSEFLKWNRAGGQVLAGLTARREAEKKLWEQGLYS